MDFPDYQSYGKPGAPFLVEYQRRTEPFSMTVNHYHPFYEMYYLLSGSREYFIRDTTYSVQAGDLVLIPKNEVHKTIQAGAPAHERLILHFDDRFLHTVAPAFVKVLLQPFSQPYVLRMPEPEHSSLSGIVAHILQELRQQPPAFELALSNAIMTVLLTTARYLQQHEPVSARNDSPLHQKISEVVRYLNEHYAEDLPLAHLSERFAFSPSYLSRTFKEVTGFALTDYLSLTRVKEAQRLLAETSFKIIDVASATGFENFSHFGKTFKRVAGVSPRDYRNKTQKSPTD